MDPLSGLRASLSRYRKRKLSLDGRAGGIEYASHRHGHSSAPKTGHSLQHTADSDYFGLRQPETYDPQAAFYHADALAYDHPEPFRDSVTAGTPAILSPGPVERDVARLCSLDPTINHDEARWLLREFASNVPSQPAPDEIPIDHDVRFEGSIGPTINDAGSDRISLGEIWDAVSRRPTYEASPMTQELFDRQVGAAECCQMFAEQDESVFAAYSEPMTADENDPGAPEANAIDNDTTLGVPTPEAAELGEPPAGFESVTEPTPDSFEQPVFDQLESGTPLEQVVDDQMDELDPYAMMDPYHVMNPYGMAPPGFMAPGMHMNPFGPMPPGFGPM